MVKYKQIEIVGHHPKWKGQRWKRKIKVGQSKFLKSLATKKLGSNPVLSGDVWWSKDGKRYLRIRDGTVKTRKFNKS